MGFLRIAGVVGLCLVALAKAGTVQYAASISIEEAIAVLPECALDCIDIALNSTECPPNDLACLCASRSLNVVSASCVWNECSRKEAFVTKNITAHLCNDPIYIDHDMVPALSVFIGLAGFAVLLRLVARVATKAYFWWDDLCNLMAMCGCVAYTALNIESVHKGLGKDIWFVNFDDVTAIVGIFFANMLLYTATRFLIRASIILFYLRVFPPRSDTKLGRILVITFFVNIIYNLSFFLAVVFQCDPIHSFWNSWERGSDDGHCGNINILAWVAAVTGIVFDFWLLALPFPQLISLNLHWKKKVMGGLMFGVGLCVLVVSLVRLKTINEFTRAVNPTRDLVQVLLWSGIEIDVGAICPCLPSFRLLLRKLAPKLGRTDASTYEMGGITARGTRERTGRRSGVVEPRVAAPAVSGKESHDGSSQGDSRSWCASVRGLVPPELEEGPEGVHDANK